MVSTPGNYDYINSYMFRYDGSIEIDIKMGGYMSTSYWDPSECGWTCRARGGAGWGRHGRRGRQAVVTRRNRY